jgi:hypothetical protein
MVTRRDEADELRRRIATPGLDEEAVDLEELEPELEPEEVPRLVDSAPPVQAFEPRLSPLPDTLEPKAAPPAPAFGPRPTAPPPDSRHDWPVEDDNPALRTAPALVSPSAPAEIEMAESFDGEAGMAEVETPIDVEVAPGTTRLTLRLKLTLNLKR